MKKYILTTTLLLSLAVPTYAENIIGVYGIANNNITNTAGDLDSHPVIITFGQSMDQRVGLEYEAMIRDPGFGLMAGAYVRLNDTYKVSAGFALVPETATRAPVAGYPVDRSGDYGQGGYIGLSVKTSDSIQFGLKYVRYDVDHLFRSSKCVSDCNTKHPIISTATGSGSAEREQIWLGINFVY